jgi:hypothetical protein
MQYADLLIRQYRYKGILVDTNLMLLVLVGQYNVSRIATFKRTKKYTPRIYEIVIQVISQFKKRLTTPQIMTEVDNLSRNLRTDEWQSISGALNELIPTYAEVATPTAILSLHRLHSAIGLTDRSIMNVPDVLVFTDDLPLYHRLETLGRGAINLGHLLLS